MFKETKIFVGNFTLDSVLSTQFLHKENLLCWVILKRSLKPFMGIGLSYCNHYICEVLVLKVLDSHLVSFCSVGSVKLSFLVKKGRHDFDRNCTLNTSPLTVQKLLLDIILVFKSKYAEFQQKTVKDIKR